MAFVFALIGIGGVVMGMAIWFFALSAIHEIEASVIAGVGLVYIGFAVLIEKAGDMHRTLQDIERSGERSARAAEATLEVMRAIREKRPERSPQQVAMDEAVDAQVSAQSRGWRSGA